MDILVPLVVLVLLVSCAGWVLVDARAHVDGGRPVAVYVGDLAVERPEVWAAGCLVLWILFFPVYLVARREA